MTVNFDMVGITYFLKFDLKNTLMSKLKHPKSVVKLISNLNLSLFHIVKKIMQFAESTAGLYKDRPRGQP